MLNEDHDVTGEAALHNIHHQISFNKVTEVKWPGSRESHVRHILQPFGGSNVQIFFMQL